jgi:hypothetical protein
MLVKGVPDKGVEVVDVSHVSWQSSSQIYMGGCIPIGNLQPGCLVVLRSAHMELAGDSQAHSHVEVVPFLLKIEEVVIIGKPFQGPMRTDEHKIEFFLFEVTGLTHNNDIIRS